MLINEEHLEKKEINSKVHKVRAIIMNEEGKVYITNMDYSYNFPGEKGMVNRENDVDLFWVVNPKEINSERVQLTNYEKHYHFHLVNCNFKEIQDLLDEKGENEYKRFTDVELRTCLEEFEKYRKEDKLC